jgi:hypothetical protein
MSDEKFKDNFIQFPRLIAEICANVSLSKKQVKDLCESMDITVEELKDIETRAQIEWDRIKLGSKPKRITSKRDRFEYSMEH